MAMQAGGMPTGVVPAKAGTYAERQNSVFLE